MRDAIFKSTRGAAVAVMLLGLLFGVGCESEAESSTTAKAQEAKPSGAEEAEPAPENEEPPRIVTLGGTVTEIVYALGVGDQVVAVDKTSVYPEQTKSKRTLDLFSKTSAESVLGHDPDIVIATDAVEPKEALDKIAAADVQVVKVESSETVDAAGQRIRTIGSVLERSEEAKELVDVLERDVEKAREGADSCDAAPRTLFVYARGKGTVFVSGKDTSAAKMIELVGATHVPSDMEGFKPLTPEAVVDVSPDAILLTTRGLQSLGGVEGLRRLPGLGESRAVTEERVVAIDDLKLLGFGPRTGTALLELQRALCTPPESKQ